MINYFALKFVLHAYGTIMTNHEAAYRDEEEQVFRVIIDELVWTALQGSYAVTNIYVDADGQVRVCRIADDDGKWSVNAESGHMSFRGTVAEIFRDGSFHFAVAYRQRLLPLLRDQGLWRCGGISQTLSSPFSRDTDRIHVGWIIKRVCRWIALHPRELCRRRTPLASWKVPA